MNKIIVLATLISELLAVIICLHAFFEQKFTIDRYIAGVIVIECVIMYLVNEGKAPRLSMVAVYVIMWLFCYVRFKMPLGVTTLKYFLGIAVCGAIEAVISLPNIILQDVIDTRILAFWGSVFLLAIIYVFGIKLSQRVKILDFKEDRKLQWASLFYIIAEVILVIDYNLGKSPLRISLLIIFVCIFAGYIYIAETLYAKIEVEKKNLEMELHRVYGDVYVELSSVIRKRQHDFKNQLGAIYSMHITAETLEELVAMQRQYGDKLLENCRYDSILTNCENPILAGYLYHRCLSCENRGIRVDYDIHVQQAECSFPLHELIESLGILIDNACENFEQFPQEHPLLKLGLVENLGDIKLSVANPSRFMKSSEIEELFRAGVSTKGENRGLGLNRLKEICIMHDAEIKVENDREEKSNWLRFEIHIPK